jgi:hypothetical protein
MKSLAALVIAVLVAAVGLWEMSGDASKLRSRLTLVVETPEGDRSGSSVRETTVLSPGSCNRAIGFGSLSTVGEEGEAVVVDLGTHGVLFATLASETLLRGGQLGMYTAALTPFQRFRGPIGKGLCPKDEYASYIDEVQRQKLRGELPLKDLPVLVRFKDMNEPTSVEQVDPFDLAKSFGPGVRLKGAFIEITDDPLTNGIASRLPWLTKAQSSFRKMLISPPPGPQTLSEASTIELLGYDDFHRDFHL